MTFGSVSSYLRGLKDIDRREFHILMPFLILTVLFGIIPNVILEGIHLNMTNILFSEI
jgi:NADH-ubiquinone oxidoreductase chain 4